MMSHEQRREFEKSNRHIPPGLITLGIAILVISLAILAYRWLA
jgi:hypothetical protein